jgi:DNA-binding FrmR family transcriptional regulator
MQTDAKKTCARRLKRIEGQVRGLIRMIEDDRYCIEIIDQLQAVMAAARKVESEILKDHLSHCVEHAINSGDPKVQRKKIEELVATLSRTRKLGN